MNEWTDLSEGEIDFARHGIVEAHAGSGKTHAIVHRIALPLLSGETAIGTRLHVRDLLLVTYTDKAAGELRTRLREEIEARAAGETDPDLKSHLEDCAKCMGEAWIGTIHSVALRILAMFPFESSMPLRTEIVNDDEGLDEALEDVLLGEEGPWLGLPPPERAALGEFGMEKLRPEARELARCLLDPDADIDFPDRESRIRASEEAAGRALPAWRELLARIAGELLPALRGTKSRKVRNLAAHWEGLDPDVPARSLADLSSVKSGRPEFDPAKDGEAAGMEAWERASGWWAAYEPSARAVREAAAIAELDPGTELRAGFVGRWARGAADRWRRRKRERGLLSFSDMVQRLREGLADPILRAALRRRVKVAVVDEFQDTGRGPWDVFRRWFLGDEPAGILFLVGDPKQSIYSFQGADLGSYFQACGELEDAGARRYRLLRNYRSLPVLVEAVNGLLVGDPPWFLGGGLEYSAGNRARAAERGPSGEGPEGSAALLVWRDQGRAGQSRNRWARQVAHDIASRRGTAVRLPRGTGWEEERSLDWGDFAVVVPARSQAAVFAEAMDALGIPWAFYKQEGVFGSRAAREWRALLECVDEGEGDDAPLGVLCCTRVFGVPVGAYDPSTHRSGEGSPGAVVARLRNLAMRGKWAQFVREATVDTGWIGRILSGPDPDRQWMDQRQVGDWIVRELRDGREGPGRAAARLRRLADGDERADDDRNLFQRSTDRMRVQILTMHASKGLEFPVVYLAGGRSVRRSAGAVSRWTTPDGLRVRPGCLPAPDAAEEQEEAESRRLLYVALTRARFLCAVPIMTDSGGRCHDGLGAALDGRDLRVPGVSGWEEAPSAPDRGAGAAERRGAVVGRAALSGLSLARRSLRQASFTALARGLPEGPIGGRLRKSGESDEEAGATGWLPRGARTGDALHEILESLLDPASDLSWVRDGEPPPPPIRDRARAVLVAGGLGGVDPARVLELLAGILRGRLDLPDGGEVRLVDVPGRDRRCEVEFLRAAAADGSPPRRGEPPSGWVVGHIDLLFRWRGSWYVVDWKSNDLPGWGPEELRRSVEEHRYDLQAALYAQAARDALPGEKFGGCAWIFLRAPVAGGLAAWTCHGDATGDAAVDVAVAQWREREEGTWTP